MRIALILLGFVAVVAVAHLVLVNLLNMGEERIIVCALLGSLYAQCFPLHTWRRP